MINIHGGKPKEREKKEDDKGRKLKLFQRTEAAASALLTSCECRRSWWEQWRVAIPQPEIKRMMKVAAVLNEEGGSQPLQCSISLLLPCCPDQGQLFNALGPSSWTPRAASSCWEAPLLQTRSWGRSPRRRPTRQYLWSWCTVCCQTTGSWPGAEWSPSPFPGRGLKTT